ncbi:MAG: DUF2848 family protein [Candidatus Rokubacteria bacterium]|nr:DUF2848 family protein [Candidatus Rokubacteria bacterium]
MATSVRLGVLRNGVVVEEPFRFVRMYNLGFTMRDPLKMQAHLDEVVKAGVPAPKVDKPPMIMPISDWALTTDTEVSAQRERTSGEVEIVTILRRGEMFVGVGSDHTDRTLEASDIPWSKQVCANVLAPVVWPWADVRGHWDTVALESDVVVDGRAIPYQRAGVVDFWTPEEMARSLEGRVAPPRGDSLIFSGTVVSLDHQLNFADTWTIRMVDPVRRETIEHTYRVPVLARELL